MPAQLRPAADGYTGGDQSPVHRARRRVLGVVSRRGVGVQDHHQPQWGDGDLLAGDGGTCGCSASLLRAGHRRRSPTSLVSRTFPDAQTAYEIPNAMVGYQPGYGEVADCWPQGANSELLRMRVMVMVAVKNDLALVAAAVGPFHEFGPDFGSGKPSGANLQLALDMGKYVNSFTWRGDPLADHVIPRRPWTTPRSQAVSSVARSLGGRRFGHSHSMVPGGLLVTSSTTRLTSGTSLVMRVEIRSSTS